MIQLIIYLNESAQSVNPSVGLNSFIDTDCCQLEHVPASKYQFKSQPRIIECDSPLMKNEYSIADDDKKLQDLSPASPACPMQLKV